MKKAFLFGIGILLAGNVLAFAQISGDAIDTKSSGGSVSAEEFNLMTEVTNLFIGSQYNEDFIMVPRMMASPEFTAATKITTPKLCLGGACKEEWPTSTSGVTLPDFSCDPGFQLQSVTADGTFTCGNDLTAAGSGVTDFNCDPGEYVEGYRENAGVGTWSCAIPAGGSGVSAQTCLEGAGYVVNGIDASGVFTCVRDATGTSGTSIIDQACLEGELVKGITGGTFDCMADQTTAGGSADNLGNHIALQNILPDMTGATAMIGDPSGPAIISQRSIGSPTQWFRNLYVEDLHLGNESLYMNGVKILESDPTVEMKFTADVNQKMSISTAGTGIMAINAAEGDLNVEILGGTASRLLKIKNNSAGGDIEIATGTGSSDISLQSPVIKMGTNMANTNVGINFSASSSSNPQYDLDVNGDINFTGDLYQNGVLYGGGTGDDPTCTPVLRSSHKCVSGDLWWYDSCGTMGDKKQECGTASCTTGEVNLPCNGIIIPLAVPSAPRNVAAQYPKGGYCLKNSSGDTGCSLTKIKWDAPTTGAPINAYILKFTIASDIRPLPPVWQEMDTTNQDSDECAASIPTPYVFNSSIFNSLKNIFYETTYAQLNSGGSCPAPYTPGADNRATSAWVDSIASTNAADSIESLIESIGNGEILSDQEFLKDVSSTTTIYRKVEGDQLSYLMRSGDIPNGTWTVSVRADNAVGSGPYSNPTSSIGIIAPVPSVIGVEVIEQISNFTNLNTDL